MNYKSIIMAAFLLVGGIASSEAQDLDKKDVPQTVKTVFIKSYPKATDVDWELKGTNYEVSFDLGKTDHKAVYSPTGKIISLQKDIPKNQLPVAISKNIKSKYPNTRIDDVDWISTSGKITYKVDLEGTPDVNVWYTRDGKFIKEVAD